MPIEYSFSFYAYLQSIPKPANYKNIPLLNRDQ